MSGGEQKVLPYIEKGASPQDGCRNYSLCFSCREPKMIFEGGEDYVSLAELSGVLDYGKMRQEMVQGLIPLMCWRLRPMQAALGAVLSNAQGLSATPKAAGSHRNWPQRPQPVGSRRRSLPWDFCPQETRGEAHF